MPRLEDCMTAHCMTLSKWQSSSANEDDYHLLQMNYGSVLSPKMIKVFCNEKLSQGFRKLQKMYDWEKKVTIWVLINSPITDPSSLGNEPAVSKLEGLMLYSILPVWWMLSSGQIYLRLLLRATLPVWGSHFWQSPSLRPWIYSCTSQDQWLYTVLSERLKHMIDKKAAHYSQRTLSQVQHPDSTLGERRERTGG